MGQPKLALPLGERTVLEHVVHALRQGGIDEVLVVVGPHVPHLAPLARGAGALVLQLPEETPDMRTTVEFGLCWLKAHRNPGSADAWMLVPADHPALEASVVRALLQVPRSPRLIVVPTYQGKRGHPLLLGWDHVVEILRFRAGVGLNCYLRAQPEEIVTLAVDAESILWDLDEPQDYIRLKLLWDRGGIPAG